MWGEGGKKGERGGGRGREKEGGRGRRGLEVTHNCSEEWIRSHTCWILYCAMLCASLQQESSSSYSGHFVEGGNSKMYVHVVIYVYTCIMCANTLVHTIHKDESKGGGVL